MVELGVLCSPNSALRECFVFPTCCFAVLTALFIHWPNDLVFSPTGSFGGTNN